MLDDAATIPALAAHVADPEGNVRRAVVMALCELDDPSTLRPLAAAMRDANEGIAREAVGGVARLGGEGAVEALIGLVNDRSVQLSIRNRAAWSLRDLKDPEGLKAAERHFASQGVQWQRGFYFAPLLYALAFWAARKEQVRPKLWGFVLYLTAMASMLAVVGLFVFPQGMVQQTYVLTLLAYPMGLLLGAALVAAGLWGRGVEPGITQGFVRRIAVCLPLMWGTVVAWYALAWVLTAVKFMLAWR